MRSFFLLSFLLFPLLATDTSLQELRLNHYKNFISEIKSDSKEIKLEKVNNYFNRIVNNYDMTTWGVEDYWATPREFISRGSGDCEDFVIAKYFTLLQLGIPKSDLLFYIVKVQNERDYHAVLGVKNGSQEIEILDNLSWKILPIEKREDLKLLIDLQENNRTQQKNRFLSPLIKNFKEVNQRILREK